MSEVDEKLAEHGIRPVRGQSFREGTDSYTLCPNCSPHRKPVNRNKPVLSVKLDAAGGAVWHCNHCGWSGNVPQERRGRDGALANGHRSKEPPRPARQAPPPEQRQRPTSMMEFFARRCIAAEVVEEMGLYFTRVKFPQDYHLAGEPPDWSKVPETPCIAFPYTFNGQITNHKYRDANKRFCQDPKALRSLYNADQIAEDELIWVEGEMDVLACLTAGFRSVVSLPDGAPSKLKEEADPSREHDKRFQAIEGAVDRLMRVKKVIIATDGDGPGLVLAEEIARRIGKDRCWRVRFPDGCKDANDVLMKYGAEMLRLVIAKAKPYPVKGIYTADDYEAKVLALYRGEIQRGLTTGFKELDELMRFTGSGLLVIVTGIPNHGKSEFLDQLMVNYCRLHGWRVAYCSFENEPAQHIAKLSEKVIGKPFRRYDWTHVPPMDAGELEMALEWVADRMVFLRAEDESPTPEWILEKAKHAVLRHGVKALVVDPYNEIEHRRPSGMTETEYLSQLLGKFRRFGEHHGVDIFVVAHPTKMQKVGDGAEPVPDLYDIAGGAHWNNKADIGFTVWRDKANPQAPVMVKIHKVRNKDLGKQGVADFLFYKPAGTYSAI